MASFDEPHHVGWTGDPDLDEYCRTGKVTDTREIRIQNASAVVATFNTDKCHLAGMTWYGHGISTSHGLLVSISCDTLHHGDIPNDTPEELLTSVHCKFTAHPFSAAKQPVSIEFRRHFPHQSADGQDTWRPGLLLRANEIADNQDAWLDQGDNNSLRLSISVTMCLESEGGIALLRSLYGVAPSTWLPSTIIATSAAAQEAIDSEGMRMTVQGQTIQLASEQKPGHLSPAYRAAVAALLGVPGLSINHESDVEHGTQHFSITLHMSACKRAGLLRSIASTRQTSGENSGWLDIPLSSMLQVLAISVQKQWLSQAGTFGAPCQSSVQYITHLCGLLKAAHFLQHDVAAKRIEQALPSCLKLEKLEVAGRTALLQALQDLPLDVSAQIINSDCSGALDVILSLPTPFLRIWLRSRYAREMQLGQEQLSAASFAVLMFELPLAIELTKRLRRFGLDLTALPTAEPRRVSGCDFIADRAQDGSPVCQACQQLVKAVHPLALVQPEEAATVGDSAIQELSRIVHCLPELTHLGPLKFYLSAHNLAWLQHLFAGALRVTHVDICAVATRSPRVGATGGADNTARPCFAQLFLESFMALPRLEELRLTGFPGSFYGCMFDVLRGHPALKRVVIDGALLHGAVPPSMRGIVKRSREDSDSQSGAAQS